MSKNRLCVLAAAFAAIVLLLTVSSRVAFAAADNTFGMALMGAYVGYDGTNAVLLSGSGVTGVTRSGVGGYTVNFDRDLQGCFAVATLLQSIIRLFIQATPSGSQVSVSISADNGGFVDAPFNLIVYCPR